MKLLKARLFRTAAFRWSLLAAGLYSLLSAAGIGFIYWSTADHMEAQIDARLRLETNVLLDRYRRQAMPALVDALRQRGRDNGQRKIFFYFLRGPGGERGVSHPRAWPAGLNEAYGTLRLRDVFPDQQAGADDWVRVLATRLPGGYRLLVGRDLNDERNLLLHFF